MGETEKTLKQYMDLPYAIMLFPDEESGWIAHIPDLPGCMTFGDTQVEALEMLEDAKLTWISGRLVSGDPIPEPTPTPTGG